MQCPSDPFITHVKGSSVYNAFAVAQCDVNSFLGSLDSRNVIAISSSKRSLTYLLVETNPNLMAHLFS